MITACEMLWLVLIDMKYYILFNIIAIIYLFDLVTCESLQLVLCL